MNSTEFRSKLDILNRYFQHSRFECKCNEDFEFQYHKGKKNLAELHEAIEIVFSDEYLLLNTKYITDLDKKIVGATMTCSFYIDADFNGFSQGTAGANCTVQFSLARYGYWTELSTK